MAMTNASAATGACTKKIARQSSSWVSMPPSAGPMTAPAIPAAAQRRMPAAREPRSAPSTGNDAPRSIAAPAPCTHRANRSADALPASPAPREAAENNARPHPTSSMG